MSNRFIHSRKLRSIGAMGTLVLSAGLVLAACGGGSFEQQQHHDHAQADDPDRDPDLRGGAWREPELHLPVHGLRVLLGEQPQQFQELMYRPLYWFGLGASSAVQFPLSLANAPMLLRQEQAGDDQSEGTGSSRTARPSMPSPSSSS